MVLALNTITKNLLFIKQIMSHGGIEAKLLNYGKLADAYFTMEQNWFVQMFRKMYVTLNEID